VTTAPWRTAGADISDFFNYGLTERTWRQYQVNMRGGGEGVNATGSNRMGGDMLGPLDVCVCFAQSTLLWTASTAQGALCTCQGVWALLVKQCWLQGPLSVRKCGFGAGGAFLLCVLCVR